MRFTREMIEAIVQDRKSQTRRLVKPGEIFNTEPGKGLVNAVVNTISARVRYCMGQDYTVQPESGGKGVWWCSECKRLTEGEECNRLGFWKPLKILITALPQERLLDISKKDIKAESFGSKREFLIYFYTLHKDREEVRSQWPFNFKIDDSDKNLWNPLVWNINFKVVK